MEYTAEDVKNILVAFVEEFLVDIPAKHDTDGYWIEFTDLSGHVILADDEWFEDQARHVNYKLTLDD